MELFRALAVLCEPPRAETARVAEVLGLGRAPTPAEFTEVFVFQLPPYASVYLGAEGMLGGEARDRVAGFWRAALGREAPPAEPDHLPLMLALYARLAEFEGEAGDAARRAGWRAARKAFLWEHLSSWLPCYLRKLAEVAPAPYRAWGEVLAAALAGETAALGRPERLPLHLREAAPAADPRAAPAEEFLRSLLAPARCGMILTRSDLARAARETNLSTRAGERLFVLRTLLGQDAAGLLGWLAAEAARWASRHRQDADTFGEVALWWEARARATSTLLEELRQQAADVQSDARERG
jgi:TorA maturation chaperone TorD